MIYFRYTGKHYEELEAENQSLKAYLDRAIRENTKLQGHLRREGNTTLHKLELEQALEAKHAARFPSIELI